MPQERTLQQIIQDLTWADIVADGVTTLEDIESALRTEGVDPNKYDYLYD
ncbi:hypothetical protein [Nocardioides zhouii]|nr:hypothetical protein [Nocardioides zhouii]